MLPLNDDNSGSVTPDEITISDYLPMVGHLVRETLARVPAHVDRDDLTSAGMMALVQAAQSFAAELGVTDSRISQMRAEALVLLQGAMRHAPEEQTTSTARAGAAERRRTSHYDAVAARCARAARPVGPTLSSAC